MYLEEQFIPYNLAIKLKELGFDEECFICKVIGKEHLIYTPSDYEDFPEQKEKEVLIPLYQQAFRFFREKYGLDGIISIVHSIGNIYTYSIWKGIYENDYDECFNIYEEAELACLKKLIEIANKK